VNPPGCSFCDKASEVTINEIGACLEHVDDAFKLVGEIVRMVHENISEVAIPTT
jgi:hypothetical protein